MSTRRLLVVLATVTLSFAGATGAESPPTRQPGKGACADDVQKFCADAPRGRGGVVRCLKKHENELSQACRDRMAAARERAKQRREACEPDVKKYCANIRPGGGRIITCLRSNRDRLSEACAATFRKPRPPEGGAKPADG